MTAAPGQNEIDRYGIDAYQRSDLVVADGVKIKVVRGGSVVNDNAEPTVHSSDIRSVVKLTQAAYDLLSPPSATTLYVIVG